MAFGARKGTLGAAANSITNPFAATGSVAVVIGDLVVAVFAEQTNLTVTTVSDNLGHSYTALNAGTDAGAITGRGYYCRVTSAGTLTSIAAVATGSADNVAAAAVVIEGPFQAAPLDANPANITSDAASPFTCPATGTLAQATEVVIAWGAANYGTVWTATAPNSLAVDRASQSVAKVAIGNQTVAATTSVVPVFAAAGNPTQAILATASFKADLTLALAAGLFTEADTFHAATVTRGAVDLAAPLYSAAAAFFLPTVGATYPLTPPLLSEADTFYSPTVDALAGAGLNPLLYVDADTFFGPVVAATVALSPALFAEADAFFSATIAPGAVGLAPALHGNANTFYAAAVDDGSALAETHVPSAGFLTKMGRLWLRS